MKIHPLASNAGNQWRLARQPIGALRYIPTCRPIFTAAYQRPSISPRKGVALPADALGDCRKHTALSPCIKARWRSISIAATGW